MENQREHYRILYPERDRPILLAAGTELEIVDLSESGACCIRNPMFVAGAPVVSVQVLLRDGTKFLTTASFIREEQDRVAVHFRPPIPLPIIFAEQRRLRRLYPQHEE